MIGKVVGSYRIERELGRGGMGQVYLAEHITIGKRAAVKVLLPERAVDPTLVQRFFNEARAAASIRHPGMVEVFDFGNDAGGSAYLIMEWLDGESLASRLRGGRPPLGLALDVARQVASTLVAAHAQGIVHRDLKPDNLFLVPDAAAASGLRVKVLDFGIAKLGVGVAGGADGAAITATGAIVGTPLYMAPEQCEGGREVDARADLYALGAILFEMITGAPPFTGRGVGAVISAHLGQPPPSPRARVPELPEVVDALVLRLLAKDPAVRGSATSLSAELEELCARHPVARTAERAPPVDVLGATAASVEVAPPVDALAGTAASAEQAVVPASTAAMSVRPGAAGPAGPAITAAPPAAPSTAAVASPDPRRPRWLLLLAATLLLAAAGVAAWHWWPRSGVGSPDGAALQAATADQLEAWCHRPTGAACRELGRRYQRGIGVERAFDRAASAYDEGCAAADPASCAALALLHLRGQGVVLDVSRAADLLQGACDGGVGRACADLAELFAAGRSRPFEPSTALRLRRTGCDLGSATSCRDAGVQLRNGLGVDRDPAGGEALLSRSVELATAGCDGGDPDQCRLLGLAHFYGRGVARDITRAFGLLQRACDAGTLDACNDVGQLLLFGGGPQQDPRRAAKVIASACDQGSLESCESLGLLYAQGFGVPADPARAREILEGLCNRHGDAYCVGLSSLYGTGNGVPRDQRRYHELNERSCRAGVVAGCAPAAKAYLRGKVVPADPRRAEELLARGRAAGDPDCWVVLGEKALADGDATAAARALEIACDLSEVVGCEQLAGLYFSGRGVARDPARGYQMLERACREGVPTACHELATRLRDGADLPADPSRAVDLFQRACDLSWDAGCAAAADMLDGGSGLRPDRDRAAALRKRACEMVPARWCPPAGGGGQPPKNP